MKLSDLKIIRPDESDFWKLVVPDGQECEVYRFPKGMLDNWKFASVRDSLPLDITTYDVSRLVETLYVVSEGRRPTAEVLGSQYES